MIPLLDKSEFDKKNLEKFSVSLSNAIFYTDKENEISTYEMHNILALITVFTYLKNDNMYVFYKTWLQI